MVLVALWNVLRVALKHGLSSDCSHVLQLLSEHAKYVFFFTCQGSQLLSFLHVFTCFCQLETNLSVFVKFFFNFREVQ